MSAHIDRRTARAEVFAMETDWLDGRRVNRWRYRAACLRADLKPTLFR